MEAEGSGKKKKKKKKIVGFEPSTPVLEIHDFIHTTNLHINFTRQISQ